MTLGALKYFDGKGLLRAVPVVMPQQFHVARIGHLANYGGRTRNQTLIIRGINV
jgi:hypothetical protein